MNEEQLIKRKQILAFRDVFLARCKAGLRPYDRPYLPKEPVPGFDRDFSEEYFEKCFSRMGQEVELRAEDILLLEESEWLYVLEEFRFICDNLIVHERCWCGLPPCVTLPIAALAKMLISGKESYRAFQTLKNINWYCLPVIRGRIFEIKDYNEWVQELSKQSSLPRSLIKKDDSFDLAMHAGARLLVIIGRSDLFEVFKANAQEAQWMSWREFRGYLDYAEYEKVWLGAEAGDLAALLALLRYEAGVSWTEPAVSAWPKEARDEHARKLNEMYQMAVRSCVISSRAVGLEDAERLLLIAFACFSYSADRVGWEQGLGDVYARSRPHSQNFEIVSCYANLREAARDDAWWRPSFLSEQNSFTDLLDVLNEVSIPSSDHSFDADFIRYQRSLMNILVNDDRNCADWVAEIEEVAGRRCAMYGQVSWTNEGALVWPEGGEDPMGLYFVSGLVRLYLGEFGLRPDVEKAKGWLLRWNVGGADERLVNTSYGQDPGFMMLSDYLRSNDCKVDGYAWANVARMFGRYYGPSYQWMVARANELTFQELISAQRMTRKIIADLKGGYPPLYQQVIVEYLGANGNQPEHPAFEHLDVPNVINPIPRFGYLLRGLVLLGVYEGIELPDFVFDEINNEYCAIYHGKMCRGGDIPDAHLPVDHAAALASFLWAFNFDPILPDAGDYSEDLPVTEATGFMDGYLGAIERYISGVFHLSRVSSIRDELQFVAKLPYSVAIGDLREAMACVPK
jgi:hypothetical protein